MRAFGDHHPVAVAACLLSAAFVCMLRMEPGVVLLGMTGALASCFVAGVPGSIRLHGWTALAFLCMALINPLVSHHGVTVLFVMNGSPVTWEALVYGVLAAGMLVAVMHFFRAFSALMTTDKLLCIFGRLSPKLALMLSMALRYVPLFQQQAGSVQRSQTALGLYKDDNLVDRFRGGTRVFSVMTTWALENGVITADSMTARGYGTGRRTQFSIFRWRGRDVALLASTLVLLALTLWGLRDFSFTCYPAIAASPMTARAWVGHVSYGLLALLPALIQGKEVIRWRFLTSSM